MFRYDHNHDHSEHEGKKNYYFTEKGNVFESSQKLEKLKPATPEDFEKQNNEHKDKFYTSDAYSKSIRNRQFSKLLNDSDMTQSYDERLKAFQSAVKSAGKDVLTANLYAESVKVLTKKEGAVTRP